MVESGNEPKKAAAIIYGSLQDIHIGAPGHVILDTLRHLPPSNTFNWCVFYHCNIKKQEVINGIPVMGVPFSLSDRLITSVIRLLPQAWKKRYFVTSNLAFIRYLISIARTLFFLRPQLVVVHVSYPLPHMLRLILPKAKIIYYHHGSTMHSKLSPGQWNRLERSCHGIIAVSQAAFDGLLKRYGKISVPYWVLYNGSSLKLTGNLLAMRTSLRHKYHFNDKTVFIFCGRMVASKGVIPLVNAFQKLILKNNSIALLLVGDDNSCESQREDSAIQIIEEAIKKSGEAIILTGWVPKEAVASFLASADIAVLPSLAPEGISLFAIDSIALGKPLIVTDTGGNREVVINDRTGILISADVDRVEDELLLAMSKLLEDKSFFKDCSIASVDFGKEKFNMDIMSKSFIKILENVIK